MKVEAVEDDVEAVEVEVEAVEFVTMPRMFSAITAAPWAPIARAASARSASRAAESEVGVPCTAHRVGADRGACEECAGRDRGPDELLGVSVRGRQPKEDEVARLERREHRAELAEAERV